MKTRILIASIFLAFSGFSQPADYFAHTPVWRVNSMCSAPYPCVRNDVAAYFISGDTLMSDGFTWKKLMRIGNSSYTYFASPPIPPGCEGEYSFEFFEGFILQDSLKIYHRNLSENSEQLLYDFDLQVGDMLPLTKINFMDNLLVSSIDSVWVLDSWRKRIYFNQGASWIIEGIGHNAGFLESIPPMLECSHTFICLKLNGESAFETNMDDCNLPLSITQVKKRNISCFPNPAYRIITLKGISQNDTPYILNNWGNSMNNQAIWENNSWTFNLDNLANGMYVIRVKNSTEKPIVFIKN
jgi:hypothetical protein